MALIASLLSSIYRSPVFIILHNCIDGAYVGTSDIVCIVQLLERQTEIENVNIHMTIPADVFVKISHVISFQYQVIPICFNILLTVHLVTNSWK